MFSKKKDFSKLSDRELLEIQTKAAIKTETNVGFLSNLALIGLVLFLLWAGWMFMEAVGQAGG